MSEIPIIKDLVQAGFDAFGADFGFMLFGGGFIVVTAFEAGMFFWPNLGQRKKLAQYYVARRQGQKPPDDASSLYVHFLLLKFGWFLFLLGCAFSLAKKLGLIA